MSIGFPDGQRITQWLGAPLASATGAAIGAGAIVAGPFPLASWASVIVACKPTGGAVDVTVAQKISGGPIPLALSQTFHVAAGATLFEAVVLFADAVTVTFQGAAGGETLDYAIYPSNTTTSAQVITGVASINGITGRLGLGAVPAIQVGSGMSGIVRNAVGDFTVSYTTPFTSPPVVVATGMFGPNFVHIDQPNVGFQRFLVYNAAGALVDGATVEFIAIAAQ